MAIEKNKYYYLALILIILFAFIIIYSFPKKSVNTSIDIPNPEEIIIEE